MAPTIVDISNSPIDVDSGARVVLTCVVYGLPEPPTIAWLRDGVTLVASSMVQVNSELVAQDGRNNTQSLLTLNSVSLSDSGTYTCQAENSAGRISRDIMVLVRPGAEIVVVPNNTVVNAGETLRVACTAQGVDPAVTWLKQSLPITNATDDRTTVYNQFYVVNGTQGIESVLEILQTSISDSGSYTCLATSRTTRDEYNFTVTVSTAPATIETPPPSQVVAVYRRNVSIQCTARGYPLPQITWYRNENDIIAESATIDISTEVLRQGADTIVTFSLFLTGDELLSDNSIHGTVNNGLSGGNVTQFTVLITVQRKL